MLEEGSEDESTMINPNNVLHSSPHLSNGNNLLVSSKNKKGFMSQKHHLENSTSHYRNKSRSTNPHRYLRIGNLPPGTDPEALIEFLNDEMRQAGLCSNLERPVLNCLIDLDANMGFIGLVNLSMAHHALSLNGVTFIGKQLETTRPKRYERHDGMDHTLEDSSSGESLQDHSEMSELQAALNRLQETLQRTSSGLEDL